MLILKAGSMTKLTIVARNPDLEPTHRSAPKLTLVSNRRDDYDRHPNGAPMWHEFERIENDAMMEALEELELEREEREREEWRRLVEAFEWLEDHCWV
jgi:hypothetical protein